jgi:SAM-dependent MidA family methyltransferase
MTSGRRPPSGSSSLPEVIRSEAELSPSRRLTFARFMELALYHPEHGYYRQAADRPTGAGDFLTAPETHPIFGWTVARRIAEMWRGLNRPVPFDLVEYGAGSGTLGLSVIEGIVRHGETDLLAAIRYTPVETNRHRLDDLRSRFEEAGLGQCLAFPEPADDDGADVIDGEPTSNRSVPVSGVILANEFLDALPVHRVLMRGGRLRELYVAWRLLAGTEGQFVEVIGEPSTPDLAGRLAAVSVKLAEGQVAEICLGLDPWLRGAAARLERGFVLIVDYGYEATELYGPRRLAGTLLGYRGHRIIPDFLSDPGGIDLTAHVDFTALQLLGERHGLRPVALTTQAEFLVAAGLENELQALQAAPDLTLAEYARARSGIVRMLDPRHMGRFRVLTLER